MFIYDEFGHAPVIPRAWPEDQHVDPVHEFNVCADFSFKQDLWFTFASGCAIAGLDFWCEQTRERQIMWKRYFPGLNKFIEDIDFEKVNYTSVREAKGEIYIAQRWPLRKKDIERSNQSSYRKSDMLEAYTQIDSLNHQGFGWMLNRSFHWGNLLDSMPCISDMAKGEGKFSKPYLLMPVDDDEVTQPISIEEDEAYIRIYNLNPRTDYTIDFYDTETGEIIRTIEAKSSFGGVLKISSPEMKPSVRYDVAFKFYDSELGWR
jgi:WD40 repeat protein